MAEAVIVAYKDGREYEIESAVIAKRAHPDAAIVRFARTQEPYEAGTKPAAPANPSVELTIGGELRAWEPDEGPTAESGRTRAGGTPAAGTAERDTP